MKQKSLLVTSKSLDPSEEIRQVDAFVNDLLDSSTITVDKIEKIMTSYKYRVSLLTSVFFDDRVVPSAEPDLAEPVLVELPTVSEIPEPLLGPNYVPAT